MGVRHKGGKKVESVYDIETCFFLRYSSPQKPKMRIKMQNSTGVFLLQGLRSFTHGVLTVCKPFIIYV